MLRRWVRKGELGRGGEGLRFSWYNEKFVGEERWLELEEVR
jgi:hypothetical protein